MGEMIHVQLGNSGNSMGEMFLKTIQNEHGLNADGEYIGNNPDMLQRIQVYFDQTSQKAYKARAILVGDDVVHTESTLLNCLRKLINTKTDLIYTNSCCDFVPSCINWPQGYYDNKTTIDKLLNAIRKKTENCNSMQGIQVMHSAWDGIGAGLGSLLAQRLHEQYPKKIQTFYSVMPRCYEKRTIADVYNTVLTLSYLNKFVDVIFCMDFDSIATMIKLPETPSNTFGDEEEIVYHREKISNFTSGITTYLRWPCEINTDLRKLVMNLVPHPLLHFFVPGYIDIKNGLLHSIYTILNRKMFNIDNMFLKVSSLQGEHFFTVGAIFRGNITSMNANYLMQLIQNDHKDKLVKCIPHNIKTIVNRKCNTWSVSLLYNTSAIQISFQELLNCYFTNVNNNQYLSYYLGETSMEKSQFIDAYHNLNEVLDYYKKKNEVL